jgi:hypothetical protein
MKRPQFHSFLSNDRIAQFHQGRTWKVRFDGFHMADNSVKLLAALGQ